MLFGIFKSIPGLYALDTRSTLPTPPDCDKKKKMSPDIAKYLLGSQVNPG